MVIGPFRPPIPINANPKNNANVAQTVPKKTEYNQKQTMKHRMPTRDFQLECTIKDNKTNTIFRIDLQNEKWMEQKKKRKMWQYHFSLTLLKVHSYNVIRAILALHFLDIGDYRAYCVIRLTQSATLNKVLLLTDNHQISVLQRNLYS